MKKVSVKKLHPDAVLPASAHASDAGYDLVAIDDGTISEDGFLQYKTGISIAVPEGYHTEIYPRSSISKYDLALANSVGVVDNEYRGEVLVRFKKTMRFVQSDWKGIVYDEHATIPVRIGYPAIYKKGDKIAQLLIKKTEKMPFEFVEELADTVRSSGGFGSSGR